MGRSAILDIAAHHFLESLGQAEQEGTASPEEEATEPAREGGPVLQHSGTSGLLIVQDQGQDQDLAGVVEHTETDVW